MTKQISIRPLDKDLVNELTRETSNASPLCASLYMPIERASKEVRQNAIRLKNHLHVLSERLKAIGADAQVERWQLRALEFDNDMWRALQQFAGVQLVFNKDQPPFAIGLDHKPDRGGVRIGRCVHMRELLRSFLGRADALIVDLAQKEADVLAYRNGVLQPVDVPGLPLSLEAVVGRQTEPTTLQHHSAGRSTLFHGQAINKDDTDHELVRFAREVAACVDRYVKEHGGTRLFVAAAEPLASIFPGYLGANIEKVLPAPGKDTELIEKIESCLTEQRHREIADWFATWREHPDRIKGVTDAYQAAVEGRLEKLVVVGDQPAWYESVEDGVRAVTGDCQINPLDANDLIDLTIHQAWRTGAEVNMFAAASLGQDDKPGDQPPEDTVTGVARYPARS